MDVKRALLSSTGGRCLARDWDFASALHRSTGSMYGISQSVTVLDFRFGNAIRKVPVIAGRRLMAAILGKRYFGRQKLIFDPNMVAAPADNKTGTKPS